MRVWKIILTKFKNMISFSDLLLILLVHWLADFCLQTDYQAKNKAQNDMALLYHVSTYTIVWFLASYCMMHDWLKAFGFASMTFTTHYAIDYNTSRLSKQHFDKDDTHNGFVVIGFDQILHYIQLTLCYIWMR